VNIKTFTTVEYKDENRRGKTYGAGKIDGAVIIPVQYSRRVAAQMLRSLVSVVDNSDLFTSSTLESEMQLLVNALTAPVIQPRLANSIALEIVELYPYVDYMKFLLPACIALAMYISVMIGGGMLYIDDKARRRARRVPGHADYAARTCVCMNIAGAIKAVLSGIWLTVIGSLMAGLGVIFNPMPTSKSFASSSYFDGFNGMMF